MDYLIHDLLLTFAKHDMEYFRKQNILEIVWGEAIP